MAILRIQSLRCRFLRRAIEESLRYRPRPQSDIPILRANISRFLRDDCISQVAYGAAIDLICKSCVRLRELGQTVDELRDFITTAQGLARLMPTFPWNNRQIKSLALRDIGTTMHKIGWDRAETLVILRESLREAAAINGSQWGNNEKSRAIKEIKDLIQKTEKSS